MKTSEQWIEEMERKLDDLKSKGHKAYYNIMAEMTKETANKVALHFAGDKNYTTEFKRCHSCENKYDIIFTWE